MKYFLLLTAFLSFLAAVPASGEDKTTDSKKSEEKTDKPVSIVKEQEDIIKYGINSEIIPLIKSLTDDKNTELKGAVYDLLKSTDNNELKNVCLLYFQTIKSDIALDQAREIIKHYESEDNSVVQSAVKYVSSLKDQESLQLFPDMMDYDNKITIQLIKGLGESGDKKYSKVLTDYYQKEDLPENIRAEIILALGRIKDENSFELLKKVAENNDESSLVRGYACNALGELGDPKGIPSLEIAYKSDDTILRSYAVYGLGLIDSPDAVKVLIGALRDSYWKVRVYAAEGLGKLKDADAVPILIYKAEKDPEDNVRNAAIEALGKIGSNDARDTITAIYENNRTPLKVRSKALDILVSDFLDASIDVFKKIIAQEWDKKNSQLLEITCKRLSTAESPALADLFAKMLTHPEITVKIHGLRGIKTNKMTQFKAQVEKLTETGNSSAVRKHAVAVLDSF